ncbi:MAG: TRAP transporter substrate-binding protein [Formivibrio sp.]|nr:TRAP transporter substrate-binding protein [Formivibrio sp.]
MSKFKPLLLIYPDNSQSTLAAVKQFVDNVARRTNGQITIAAVPISKLVNQPVLVDMVIDGYADMALPAHDRLRACSKIFGCIGAPFAFDDYAHADRVLDGEFADHVRPDLEKTGMVYLGSWEWGFRQITNSRHPILDPENMRGLKIRVPTTPLCQNMIRALGSTPVMVEFEQLARAIRQGLIDGQENPIEIIHALGLQQTQKYLCLLNYSYGTLAHVFNKNRFDNLTPTQQMILHEESRKAGQLMRQLTRSRETEQLAEFASNGVQIDRPDQSAFKALMAPVYAGMRESFGPETVRTFLDMVERQRKAPRLETL